MDELKTSDIVISYYNDPDPCPNTNPYSNPETYLHPYPKPEITRTLMLGYFPIRLFGNRLVGMTHLKVSYDEN